jgi:DNA ligase (NAD+)
MNLEYIKSNPQEFSKKASIQDLVKVLTIASDKYYSDETPIISDDVYDILIEQLEKRDKSNVLLTNIGSDTSIPSKDKVMLPYYMGSMNKVKTKHSLTTWLTKYPIDSQFVLSDKLDGISALYVNVNDNDNDHGNKKLYSRGNGVQGRNISNILEYLDLPIISDGKLVLRGELIISKANFEKHRGNYTSARSMVNGLVALKEGVDSIKLLDFVVFEVISPEISPYDQLVYAKELGFKVPNKKLVNYSQLVQWKTDEDNYVLNALNHFRKKSHYDIDGIILTHNILYPRIKGNPKNSIAFKSNNYGKVTIVRDVEWAISKYGILIPRIKFDKIDLGSIVEYCTGFSGKYIFNNCIGPGTKIRVTLSGDVIPYLTEIISSTYPKMPGKGKGYEWSDNKLHCKSIGEDSDMAKKKIIHFIKTLKIDYLSIGLISKLYDHGYKSISSILDLNTDDLLAIDGFKDTLASKIINSIQSVTSKPIYLGLLMVASLEFNSGYGLKRIKKILDVYPNLMKNGVTLEQIVNIDGFQVKTGNQFIDNFEGFRSFMSGLNLDYYVKTEESVNDAKNPNIDGKYFVMTGFRDTEIIDCINKNGGILQNDVNMKTEYLIVKDLSSGSGKIKKAQIMGVDIIDVDGFNILK